MRKLIYLIVAAIVSGSVLTPAQAATYTRHEVQNNDVCYTARRVPATVEYNTRGIKLRDASRSWEGNMYKHGAKIRDRHHDEVYIQTRRVVENQHMTLIPRRC